MFNYLLTQHVNIIFKHHLISITRNPGRKYQDSTRNPVGILVERTRTLPGLYQESWQSYQDYQEFSRNTWSSGKFWVGGEVVKHQKCAISGVFLVFEGVWNGRMPNTKNALFRARSWCSRGWGRDGDMVVELNTRKARSWCSREGGAGGEVVLTQNT